MLYFSMQNRFQDRTSKVSEAAGARWRFHGRITVGLSSNRLYIGGSNSESFRCNLELKDFVAGAVFAEVGGWHCLLCALEMKFHMRRGSNMRFILRGRRSICWGWRLTLLAPGILNDVSHVTRINHEMHFAWQAQYLVRFEVDFACSAHSKWRFICDADQSCFILRGTGSIWWGSRLTLLAPRILNDVSYETRINHEMHFAWQAQFLVKLEASTLLLRAL